MKNRIQNSEFRIKKYKSRGFTLVELLVVIAVIGVILGLAVPNFFAARERARDAQRKSDLSQIQKAFELYKGDQAVEQYPAGAVYSGINCGQTWPASGNVYMKKFPCDPSNPTTTKYVYQRNATDSLRYTLTACLENPADPDRDATDTCAGNTVSYTITEP